MNSDQRFILHIFCDDFNTAGKIKSSEYGKFFESSATRKNTSENAFEIIAVPDREALHRARG